MPDRAPRAGRDAPYVLVVEAAECNALVARRGRRAAMAVTTGALATLTRTELEAVVAHCLVRCDPARLAAAGAACAFGPLLMTLAPRVGYDDDVAAAALTRYPPGLARALRKCDGGARFAPLWLVAPGPLHRPVEERVAELEQL